MSDASRVIARADRLARSIVGTWEANNSGGPAATGGCRYGSGSAWRRCSSARRTIIIDFGVGLFDLHGTLTLTEAATLGGVALIQLWWAISFMADARGNGSGVASVGILGAGWAALTNGFPIVYCPPVCEEPRPLTDLGHVRSIVFGILLALVAIWSLWRARVRPGWFMPAVAAVLVVGTVVSLANTPIT
jgi:hypothetical protein